MKPEPDNYINDKVCECAEAARAALAANETDKARALVIRGLEMVAHAPVELAERGVAQLVTSAFAAIERGGWCALLDELPRAVPPPRGLPMAQVALACVRGRCLRRAGRLTESAEAYAAASENVLHAGPLHTLLMLHTANAKRLLGRYDEALSLYERVAQAPATQAGDATALQAKLARADSLMLRGRFREAVAMLETLKGVNTDDALWDSQVERVRGHVLRFNFRLDEALHAYVDCLRVAERCQAQALRGELLADIAATRCWTEPQAALADAQAAIEDNRVLGAPIEVAKAQVAQALASALKGDADSASIGAEVALGGFGETGYRAGEMFALLAKGLAFVAADAHGEVAHIANTMRTVSAANDGAYAFLTLPLRVWAQARPIGRVDWLDKGVKARIREIFEKNKIGGSSKGIVAPRPARARLA